MVDFSLKVPDIQMIIGAGTYLNFELVATC